MLKVQYTPQQQLITVNICHQKRLDNVVYFYIYVTLSEVQICMYFFCCFFCFDPFVFALGSMGAAVSFIKDLLHYYMSFMLH